MSKTRFLPSRFREASVLLARNATEAVPFGTFDPGSNTLTLEDAITFQTYHSPVESRDAFRLDDMFRVLDSGDPRL